MPVPPDDFFTLIKENWGIIAYTLGLLGGILSLFGGFFKYYLQPRLLRDRQVAEVKKAVEDAKAAAADAETSREEASKAKADAESSWMDLYERLSKSARADITRLLDEHRAELEERDRRHASELAAQKALLEAAQAALRTLKQQVFELQTENGALKLLQKEVAAVRGELAELAAYARQMDEYVDAWQTALRAISPDLYQQVNLKVNKARPVRPTGVWPVPPG